MKVGIDICSIKRIEDILNEKFINKILTEDEITQFNSKGQMKPTYIAGRFAAKEALSKAIGTGIGKIGFKDIEVLNYNSGEPYIKLSGNGKRLWFEKFKEEPVVSISHENDYAVAIVTGNCKEENFNINPPFSLKERDCKGHKGSFGKVGIIAGSKGMVGSVYLSSMAALRSGSGLVYTGVCEEIFEIMQIKCIENIIKMIDFEDLNSLNKFYDNLDALGVGPGLRNVMNLKTLEHILKTFFKSIVIDADGLNTISEDISILSKNKNLILTPHEGEFSRLLNVPLSQISSNREILAKSFAKQHSVILVLKGSNTIVTDGNEMYVNKSGTSGLATAGSGDVLTGIITSLLGQGYEKFQAACLGVYIHGLCGNFLEQKFGTDGIIAGDILNEIPMVIKALRET